MVNEYYGGTRVPAVDAPEALIEALGNWSFVPTQSADLADVCASHAHGLGRIGLDHPIVCVCVSAFAGCALLVAVGSLLASLTKRTDGCAQLETHTGFSILGGLTAVAYAIIATISAGLVRQAYLESQASAAAQQLVGAPAVWRRCGWATLECASAATDDDGEYRCADGWWLPQAELLLSCGSEAAGTEAAAVNAREGLIVSRWQTVNLTQLDPGSSFRYLSRDSAILACESTLSLFNGTEHEQAGSNAIRLVTVIADQRTITCDPAREVNATAMADKCGTMELAGIVGIFGVALVLATAVVHALLGRYREEGPEVVRVQPRPADGNV